MMPRWLRIVGQVVVISNLLTAFANVVVDNYWTAVFNAFGAAAVWFTLWLDDWATRQLKGKERKDANPH